WTSEIIPTSYFELQAFMPERRIKHPLLTVFIEGDGLAWISRAQPSSNPTPLDPVSLKLALAYKHDHAVAYLGCPCQFTQYDARCTQKYWTSHRFSEEVIASTSEAISVIKNLMGASDVQLYGYSGGGAAFTTTGIKPSATLVNAGVGYVTNTGGGLEITAHYDLEVRSGFTT
ncbi:MAG TPA: hypothetical protein VFM76_02535, partial [Methylophaga sp.]|nr:hypothetical protein [Methylophaga sp.]